MKIYTSYYGKVKSLIEHDIVPISISAQFPTWFNGERIKQLAPRFDMLKLPKDEYRREYIEILEKINMSSLSHMITQLSKGQDVALLCFESLKKEGEWCHRTMFASWMNEKFAHLDIQEFKTEKDLADERKTEYKNSQKELF